MYIIHKYHFLSSETCHRKISSSRYERAPSNTAASSMHGTGGVVPLEKAWLLGAECNSEGSIRLGIPPSILSVEWVELPASQICSVNYRGNLQLGPSKDSARF